MNKFSSAPHIMDIDELDAFLMSDQMPDDCMQICDMDGFLTAIAIGPDMVMPSEWLPYITGGQEPEFETEKQAQAFFGGVMEWYNGILRTLSEAPEEYEPYIYENMNGDPIFSDWAEGFLIGVSLRQEAWNALRNSKEYSHYFTPIVAHMPDFEKGGFLIGDDVYEKMYEVLKNDTNIIPNAVIQIDRFWKQTRKYYEGRTKIGRNDPCFCGSGKKFKKCCGMN